MILDVIGDVFEIAASLPTPAVAHGVNTTGVMGAGVAKTVKTYWPEMFTEYQQLCQTNKLNVGELFIWQTPTNGIIANLATQDKPGKHAEEKWIQESIIKLNTYAKKTELKSIAMVRIGCGLGGLNWKNVAPIINAHTPDLAILACTQK